MELIILGFARYGICQKKVQFAIPREFISDKYLNNLLRYSNLTFLNSTKDKLTLVKSKVVIHTKTKHTLNGNLFYSNEFLNFIKEHHYEPECLVFKSMNYNESHRSVELLLNDLRFTLNFDLPTTMKNEQFSACFKSVMCQTNNLFDKVTFLKQPIQITDGKQSNSVLSIRDKHPLVRTSPGSYIDSEESDDDSTVYTNDSLTNLISPYSVVQFKQLTSNMFIHETNHLIKKLSTSSPNFKFERTFTPSILHDFYLSAVKFTVYSLETLEGIKDFNILIPEVRKKINILSEKPPYSVFKCICLMSNTDPNLAIKFMLEQIFLLHSTEARSEIANSKHKKCSLAQTCFFGLDYALTSIKGRILSDCSFDVLHQIVAEDYCAQFS